MVLPPVDPGLSTPEAAQRLREDGPSVLASEQRRTWVVILREALREPMFMLLLAAGALYLVLGNWQDGLVMFGLVLVVMALTLYQEGRTERALAALHELTSPRAQVLRDGLVRRIPGSEVVRGDLLVLAQGDRIAADARLLSGTEVQLDESLLTNERDFPVPSEPRPVRVAVYGTAVPRWRGKSVHQLTYFWKGKSWQS